ncbi:MAG: hypothetical protein M5R36_29925 [Deltaproteobacteria bacterium]|nr:hypothetical protein [Deltaproteobacteria bacterium]
MLRYKEAADYLRPRRDYVKLRRRLLHVSDREDLDIRLSKLAERGWALYRERGLLPQLATGDANPSRRNSNLK